MFSEPVTAQRASPGLLGPTLESWVDFRETRCPTRMLLELVLCAYVSLSGVRIQSFHQLLKEVSGVPDPPKSFQVNFIAFSLPQTSPPLLLTCVMLCFITPLQGLTQSQPLTLGLHSAPFPRQYNCPPLSKYSFKQGEARGFPGRPSQMQLVCDKLVPLAAQSSANLVIPAGLT